jgi:bacteriocin biosynthesis cyclodehydratase domain-containing protein
VVAVVCVGEPPRAALDRHVRGHVPHLLVRLLEGRALLGPFVVPGTTPCLRCLDAHLTDADPSWPLLVEQYARAVRVARDDGVPEPVDAALASLAIAWAVRDLATYAEGGTPTTLATTVELGPRLETIETRAWSPHHRCGCSWR